MEPRHQCVFLSYLSQDGLVKTKYKYLNSLLTLHTLLKSLFLCPCLMQNFIKELSPLPHLLFILRTVWTSFAASPTVKNYFWLMSLMTPILINIQNTFLSSLIFLEQPVSFYTIDYSFDRSMTLQHSFTSSLR